MSKTLIKGFAAVAGGLILGIVGLLVGIWFGGNFTPDFALLNVRGYEATGPIGFVIFALLGLVVSWRAMTKILETK